MAKSANAGELRTAVYVKKVERQVDASGFPSDIETNVFGEGVPYMVKWVNAHGHEVFAAMELELNAPATLTGRFSPLITPSCLIYCEADPAPYEIISIDNVDNRNRWLEIKVQRKVAAR